MTAFFFLEKRDISTIWSDDSGLVFIQVFMLNTKLAEAENMTYDVVRDLLGIKMDIAGYAVSCQGFMGNWLLPRCRIYVLLCSVHP